MKLNGIGFYFECMGHAVAQRKIIFLVAYGKVETHGEGEGFDPLCYDVIYGVAEFFAGIVGFDLEAADDETGQAVEFSRALKMIEHPVDAIKVFTRIFYKQDLTRSVDIATGAGEGFDGLQVAADEDALGISGTILRMKWYLVLHFVAGKRPVDGEDGVGLHRFRFRPVIRKAIAHLGMDGGQVEIGMKMTKQYGDIAKADDPFGFLS